MTAVSSTPEAGLDAGTRPVLLEFAGEVATLTLNNPRRKNAMNAAGWRALGSALAEVAASQARVLVVTGAGSDFPVFRGR